jgi:hypothetical protein
MKYYVNFAVTPVERVNQNAGANNQTLYALNPNFRMPQAPMYQQDGVYNQMCKYRLVNFQLPGLSEDDLVELNDKTMILRFRNVGTRNQFNLFNGRVGAPTQFTGNGTFTPLEFHIRAPKQIVQLPQVGVATTRNNRVYGSTDTVELIAPPMWGEVPEIVLLHYRNAEGITDADPDLEIDIVFTLEIEPIYSKIN